MNLSPTSRVVDAPRRLAALVASTLLALSSALHAGPPAEPAQAPATGTIKGKLIWAGGAIPAPKPEAAAANAKDAICKTKPIMNKDLVVDPDTKGIADGFAWLVNPAGDFSAAEKALLAKTPAVVVDQVNCEYVPYASVVHKDQKLTFKSSDPVGHNVDFKPFSSPGINPMLPPNGSAPFAIKKGEKRPYAAICALHPWMKGWVLILDHPLAAVTKTDGSFEITGVPAGEQHLIVWQSKNGYATDGGNKGMTITVKAGETVDVGPLKITKP